ncbi:MAG TPA: aminomethyl transferase family protein, partial [Planctomycetes bacterium]|nr:aminomethyl transferase family protein [Planctomycetota bacterium]
HDRLAARGACFGSKMGLERPLWFAPPGQEPVMEYSFGKQNWFEAHADEHRGTREKVAIFDQTSFSKFTLDGKDALRVLERLCGNDIDVAVGKVVYTGLFNERGTFESDLSVIRTGETSFYIVTSSAQTIRDHHWIRSHIDHREDAVLVDVTTDLGVLGVMGPRSRDLLQQVTDADLDSFPFGTSKKIVIGDAMVRAARITYVGELGWELHVGMADLPPVYDAIREAGDPLGLIDGGHYAINSLRLEKGYRAWGAELTVDDTPLEAGLSFALAWEKPIPFLGRDALLRQKEGGVCKKMVSFLLEDPEVFLWHDEPIYRDGLCVGYTSSAAYGHTLGASVALGYVRSEEPISRGFITSGSYQIDVAGTRVGARVSLKPLLDPQRERILA